MATDSWKVDADGDWSTATDWSAGQVPQTGDQVVIDTADFHTITYDSAALGVTIGGLSLGNDAFDFEGGSGLDQTLSVRGSASFGNLLDVNGGTLNFNALNVSIASFEQDAGAISGTGTLTVSGDATIGFNEEASDQSGSGTTLLDGITDCDESFLSLERGRVLENAGVFDFYDSGSIALDSATIKNDSGATFAFGSNTNRGLGCTISGEDGATFSNAGAIEMIGTTTGLGKADIGVALTNTGNGTVNVQYGRLILSGGGSSSANAFTVAGVLDFGGGAFTMSGGAYSIAGETEVSGGTADFSRSTITSFGSELLVTGGMSTHGTLELGSNSVAPTGFEQIGGTVSGTGMLTLTGAQFDPATLKPQSAQTGSGTTLLHGTTTIYGLLAFDGGRVFENAGALDLNGALLLGHNPFGDSVGGGTFKNDASATLEVAEDAEISRGAGTDTFINAGAFDQTSSAFETRVKVKFTNTGTLSVQGGVLELAGGGSSSASAFTIASGATLDFGGGDFALTGGQFNNSGVTEVSGGVANFSKTTIASFGTQLLITGGTLALGANSISPASFTQGDGTLSGTGVVTLSGGQTIDGGTETGSGKTLLEGTTTLYSVALDGGRVLENAGTVDWTGGEIWLGQNLSGKSLGGATLKNDSGATFDIKAANKISAGVGADAFVNAGLLQQTGVKGTTNIAVTLTNSGRVTVDSGVLDFSAGGASLASAFTIAQAATIEFGGGTFDWTGGSYASSGLTEVSAGVLALGAVAAKSARFEQTGGEVAGSGLLSVTGAATLDAAKGDWDFERGAGTTLLKGVTTDTSLIALDAKRVLENAGTFDWISGADIELGFDPHGGSVGGGTIKNEAGATFDIETSVSVVAYSGADAFVNAGLLELTRTPLRARFDVNLANSGSVVVKSGTLDMHKAVSGTGTFKIDGAASLEFDSSVASGQRVAFTGPASGKLLLDDLSLSGSQLFHGKISDFAHGDTIDAGGPFGAGTKFVYQANSNNTAGTLELTDGSLHASLDFIGAYVKSDFHLHTDGHGGSLISYSG